MQFKTLHPEEQIDLIPDFCKGEAIFVLMVVMELVALLLALSSGSRPDHLFNNMILLSLHLQWIGLSSAAVLCMTRRWLTLARAGVVFFVSWGLLVLITLVTANVIWLVSHGVEWLPPVTGSRTEFLLRNAVISAIISVLLLQYFWSRARWKSQAKADAEGRYLALQARIRPHFLFNSLNSIAALIETQPEQAEEMVMDLADLFRVSLDKSSRLVRLEEEVNFVQTYLRIERVRLGDKLWVDWQISDDAKPARVPLLILQPLVENAVYHGVTRLTERGGITISARRELGELIVDVENPLPPDEVPIKKGTGVAIENIAQRLKLIYGAQGRLIQGPLKTESGSVYRARIQVPFKTEESAVPTPSVAESDQGESL